MGKSPILDQDEANELFKSKFKSTPNGLNDSSVSINALKMINPMEKSGFTPASITKSSKGKRNYAEDWTMDMPKILTFDERSEESSP